MTLQRTTVGILVGGGPAHGINSVMSTVTICSILGGCDVLGIIDGFKRLMEDNISHVRLLSIEEVIARQYMIRLSDEDFKDPVALGCYADPAGRSPETFQHPVSPWRFECGGNLCSDYS